MQKLHFTIQIHAPVAKVWDTMLGDVTYREWTSAFCPGSYYEGDWVEGSKIVFLGPNPDGGTLGGMLGRIAENRLHERISIEYLGLIVNGVEDTTSDEVKKWAGTFENYTFVSHGDMTELSIDIDINDEYKAMFEESWPKALEQLKILAEK